MISTVQCSICSQLNNKHRVVVTDFHTCSIIILWLHSLSGVIGASLSEPHLDELAGAFLWYIYIIMTCIYIYLYPRAVHLAPRGPP